MNLKLWAVIVGVILAFNLVQFLDSKKVDSELEPLEKAISEGKSNLMESAISLNNEISRIEAKKAQMDNMSDSEYNQNVDSYNSLVNKYKLNISKYNAEVGMVNLKIRQYNEKAKDSGVTYIIPGLPKI